MLLEDKSGHQSYHGVILLSYSNDWFEKTCLLMKQCHEHHRSKQYFLGEFKFCSTRKNTNLTILSGQELGTS